MIKQPVYSGACDHSRDRATLGTPVLGFSGLHWNVLQVLGLSASPFPVLLSVRHLLLLSLAPASFSLQQGSLLSPEPES